MEDDIVAGRAGRILRVRINRPDKHNPLSRAALVRLRRAFDDHRDDEGLACAVLTGTGERYFAAGGDLRDFASIRTAEAVRTMAEDGRAALDAVRTFPVPVVALVNGDALGGGAELALACDLRVMRDGAHIGYVQGRLAITSAWGGGPDLCAVVGPARALRMMARSGRIDAATALAWGLADAVVPADAAEDGLQAFLEPLLRQTRPALQAFKAQALAARQGEAYAPRRAAEHDAFVATWMTAEHWAAVDRILSRTRSA